MTDTAHQEPYFDHRDLAALRRAILRWNAQHGRDLPWRGVGDPYRVWISEVMLQQTTVAAVIPYYERFLRRFPDVRALAAADEADVLRFWEGLGYYSRARNLHKGAREIVQNLAGEFPSSAAELQRLPGIGRYTAGAIASFAFNERTPIVEANTLRLYCRLLGFAGDPKSSAGQDLLWTFAATFVPPKAPGRFNQALMDLGATICTPSEPKCPSCPVQRWCRAFRDNRVAEIPRATRRPAVTEVTAYAVAVHRNGEYLLRRYRPGERWGGLWDFLRFEEDDGKPIGRNVERRLAELVRDESGLTVRLGPKLAQFRHTVTRFRITLHCFTADTSDGCLRCGEEWAWARPERHADYPLSVTGRKLANCLNSRPK
jgi:A/G-specific adenine glycosylase